MKQLTVFYDARCGICCRFRTWLEAQPKRAAVAFVDYQSAEAERLLPGIRGMGADREVVVMADDGRWWQGPAAWLTCLWVTRDHAVWAHRLASPALHPLVRKVALLITENRLTLSRLLHLRANAELSQALEEIPEPDCGTDGCRIDGK